MKKTIIILLISLAAIVLLQDFLKSKKAHAPIKSRPYIILVSFDGFRYDYPQRAHTPTLDSLAKIGVKAEALVPIFPTKTFPNHYTIVTGLYAENHGLVSNQFFAPDVKEYFRHSSKTDVTNGAFFKGEPVWVTAESQRVKAASFFWVGSEAKIKGYNPSYSKPYEHNFPYQQRFDTLLYWLNKPYHERPHLITCYFDETDTRGHRFGPNGPEVIYSAHKLDSLLGNFLMELRKLPLADSVNVLVVSDHGMALVNPESEIKLDQYLKKQWIDTTLGSGAFMMIDPTRNCTDSIVAALSQVSGLTVYEKNNIPDRWHFKNSKRISELVLVANPGTVMTYNSEWGDDLGEHGYAPENREMQGIFYATGPAFKSGYNAGLLQSVDLYNLMCRILEISPAVNDGDTARVYKILK